MKRKLLLAGAGLLLVVLYLTNASRFAAPDTGSPTVLAHRGMAQRFQEGESGGCDAARILPPKHDYLENTIPSIEAAFERGADVVEIDVQKTRDNRFAVFHDRRLDCRTNGRGLVRDHLLADLKKLDVGWGYTADRGMTYPFRGKGTGLMPSIDDVLEKFPDRAFLIDLKANNSEDGAMLATRLSLLSQTQRSRLMVFGNEAALALFRRGLSGVPAFSASSIQDCLVRYILLGWSGAVPVSCRNSPLFVPVNVTPFLWGWPNRFRVRMAGAGSSIVVLGRFFTGEISPGLDTEGDFNRLPSDYGGGIWTNDVDLVISLLRNRRKDP
jgi:glycerophosphoryl diester phosphodiesterase